MTGTYARSCWSKLISGLDLSGVSSLGAAIGSLRHSSAVMPPTNGFRPLQSSRSFRPRCVPPTSHARTCRRSPLSCRLQFALGKNEPEEPPERRASAPTAALYTLEWNGCLALIMSRVCSPGRVEGFLKDCREIDFPAAVLDFLR